MKGIPGGGRSESEHLTFPTINWLSRFNCKVFQTFAQKKPENGAKAHFLKENVTHTFNNIADWGNMSRVVRFWSEGDTQMPFLWHLNDFHVTSVTWNINFLL